MLLMQPAWGMTEVCAALGVVKKAGGRGAFVANAMWGCMGRNGSWWLRSRGWQWNYTTGLCAAGENGCKTVAWNKKKKEMG